MAMSEESAEWLNKKHLTWQTDRGKKGTITEFARWLGISRGTYNNWVLKKQTPTGASLSLLGEKLGWEIYDVVGEPRPDPRLRAIQQFWGRLSEEVKAALYADATRYADMGVDEQAVAAPKRRAKK